MIKPGKKVILESFEMDDWECLYRWYYSGEYEDFFRDTPAVPGSDYFKRFSCLNNGFALKIKNHAQEIIGVILVMDIKSNAQSACLGMIIDKAHEGKGMGQEATYLIVRHLFRDLGLRKLIIEIVDGRERLMKTAHLNGVNPEAIFKKEVKIDGEFKDIIRYAIFKEEAEEFFSKLEPVIL